MAYIFIGCLNKITFLHIFDFWSTFYISDCYNLQCLSTKIYNFVNWLPADDKEIFVLKIDHIFSDSIKSKWWHSLAGNHGKWACFLREDLRCARMYTAPVYTAKPWLLLLLFWLSPVLYIDSQSKAAVIRKKTRVWQFLVII